MKLAYKWGYKVIREYRMKTGIDTHFLTSWSWKVSQGQVQGQLSKIHRMARTESSESFWRRKYVNTALDHDPITQGHA